MTTPPALSAEENVELREQMVQQLLDEGAVVDSEIEAAFRAVPRELFATPETPADLSYTVHSVVKTRFDDDGGCLSSLSAPFMQAGNLRQAHIEPGMRVLEVGSGGPLASMLAHLVGPTGHVVTVDIDEGVTARTKAGLEQTEWGDRIEVVTADAAKHLGRGMFDRIIVTVAAWTIPPVWMDQLVPDGVLVVPFRIGPGVQRIFSFRRRDGHLAVEETVLGGFVPMQGEHVHHHPTQVVNGPSGGAVTFRFSGHVPGDFAISDDVLKGEPKFAWTGVQYANREVWVDLFLWLLLSLPDACEIVAEEKADIGHDRVFLAGIVEGDSFAMVTRSALAGGSVEIGCVGKGPAAAELTQRMAESIRTYDRYYRRGDVRFAWWQGHRLACDGRVDEQGKEHVLQRAHGALVVRWPDSMDLSPSGRASEV